jgi:iron(III) transport system substrate-binding protein
MKSSSTLLGLTGLAIPLLLSACGQPQGSEGASQDAGVVNVFSARHYASDDAVYAAFTEETGIEVNVIEAGGDLLVERVRTDGDRSPADVVITVDAGRLYRAAEAGLFQPAGLDEAMEQIPAYLHHPDDLWFGFATRARVIVYAPERVDVSELSGYEDLADPRFEGRVCVRSSNNVYNQSLLAAMIDRLGADGAEAWAQGVVDNLARAPQGADTDQIRAVAAGDCDVSLVNHYYWARIANSGNPADQAVANATELFFPENTHINVSGAGLAAGAPNTENARSFLRFLLSPEAQRAFAELTNEFPAVASTQYDNALLDELHDFSADDLNVNVLGENAAEAQRIFDRVGWQ